MDVSREQVVAWRTACADGSITPDEYARAIAAMREDRYAARPQPKVAKPRKARKAKAGDAAPALLEQETTL